jgi:tetratricopeptide (TPR) repeat protein
MEYIEPAELMHAKKLMEQGEIKESLHLINIFEGKEEIEPQEQLSCDLLKSTLYWCLGDFENTFIFADQAYKASQKLGNDNVAFDSMILLIRASLEMGKYFGAFTLIEQGEELLLHLSPISKEEFAKCKGSLFYVKGRYYGSTGDFDKGIDYTEQGLELQIKYNLKPERALSIIQIGNIHLAKGDLNRALTYAEEFMDLIKDIDVYKSLLTCFNCYLLGGIYMLKGELDIALNYCNEGVEITEKIGNKRFFGSFLNEIGLIYRQKGEFNRAIDYLEQSLLASEKIGSTFSKLGILDSLFHTAIDMNNLELANQYLERLKETKEIEKSKVADVVYRIDEAVLLKTSPRLLNRGRAETILKEVIEEENVIYEMTVVALLNLCDLLLNELKNTGHLEILNEIQIYIKKMLDIADYNHSFSLLAETYLLQARLALITLDLKESRRFLTQAQDIAETNDLHRLAMKISNEHDELLKNQNLWENLRKIKAPLKERMEKARLSEQMERMLHNRAVEQSELENEEPILLLIMDQSGATYFNYAFEKDWDYSDLFSAFMSAFNTFTSEIFAKSIDRVRIGENVILINLINSFLICYVIKGQSYPARQKLMRFSEEIKSNQEVWQTLHKAVKTSEELQLSRPASIGAIVKKIFV